VSALLRADWIRLRRRRDLWAVAALLAILTVLAYGLGLSSAIASLQIVPPGVPVDRAARLAPFAFPQSVPAALQNGLLLSVAFTAYFASAVTATEFGSGTIRTSLVARHDRAGFLVARLATIGTLAVGAVVAIAVLGAALPAAAALVGAELPEVAPVTLSGAAGLIGAIWVTLLAVVSIATLGALATRNAAAGLLAVALVYGVEAGLANLGAALGEPWQAALDLLPLSSAGSLVQAAAAAATDSPLFTPGAGDAGIAWPIAAVVAIAWIVGFAALSAFVLDRSDITA
jgi:hypothetical protein